MRSVRLEPELERRLVDAARRRGESVSEFIRDAIAARVDLTFHQQPAVDFSDVVGVVHGGGGRAKRTGDAYLEALVEDRKR